MSAGADSRVPQELQQLLALAARKVRRARVRQALARVAEPAIYAAIAVGVLCALMRLAQSLRGSPDGISGVTYVVCVIVAAALPLLVAALHAYARQPVLAEVAERLDLGAGEHNRIATAVSFVAAPVPGAFAQAAIRAGLEAARRLAACHPYCPRYPVRGRQLFCGVVALVAIGLASGFRGALSPDATVDRSTALPRAAASQRAELTDQSRPQNANVKPPNVATAQASTPPATDVEVPRTPLNAKQSAAAAGRMAPGSAAAASASEQPAAAGAEASGLAGKSSGHRDTPMAKRAPGRTPQEQPPAGQPPLASEQSASASAGSAAGLCRAPAQPGLPRGDATTADRQEPETDEPTPDESKTSTQRGGIQPSLKDRQDPPNRDLGIGSNQGMPGGTGRGGPTPPKKSRGTASLVLGVPVPDFVRGRLGPGPTKIARERVPPSAAPGEPAAAAPAAVRAAAEAALPSGRVPVEFAAQVRDYLVALHSLATRLADAGAEAVPAPPGPREETP